MRGLQQELTALLGEPVHALSPIAGGDINRAFCAELAGNRRVFVKTHERPPRDMYLREAEGLRFLAEANALPVPEVLAVSQQLLALRWIESRARARDFDEQLGRGLAQLHRTRADSLGLAHDNFVGSLPQDNTHADDWPTFYAERRLWPLARRAHTAGHLPKKQLDELAKLCVKLPALCAPEEPPARLHGDLWSGNIMSDERGYPVLIDPAVYGGQREIDLAMLRLFGAPSARLFAAYDELYPRAAEADERVALYQLYPLLVHICLFGASYTASFAQALAKYS